MGKKSKRRSKNPEVNEDGAKSPTSVADSASSTRSSLARFKSTSEYHEALKACSFGRLCALYKDLRAQDDDKALRMLLQLSSTNKFVSEADMKNGCDNSVRRTMEEHLRALPVEPMAKPLRKKVAQQLQAMGGMKITFTGSFMYTCGFTSVGGKELIIQNMHESMGGSNLAKIINLLYKDHMEGKPVAHGHTISGGDIALIVEEPDPFEATLLKATKTFEATRQYGLAGYDILLLVPVGVYSRGRDGAATTTMEAKLTRQEVLAMGQGSESHGFKSLHGKTTKLEACAWCRSTRDTAAQTKLFMCSGCNDTFYCSREHQKLDWKKQHKEKCGSPKSSLKSYCEPIVGKALAEQFEEMML